MQILRFLFRLSWGSSVFSKAWMFAYYVFIFTLLGVSTLALIALFGARWEDATYGLRIAFVGWLVLWMREVIWPQIQMRRPSPS